MARKSRRARRKREARPAAKTGVAPSGKQEPVRAQAAIPEASSTTEYGEQYAYVYSDLKRIAILAGAFLAILVLLSFVIR